VFTLAELKTLRIKQRIEVRDNLYNGFFQIATLEEVIELVQQRNGQLGTTIGTAVNLKLVRSAD